MANNKETLDDIVFEHRNKEYGAYFLRKNYKNYLTRAFLFGTGFFILVFGGAYTYTNVIVPKLQKDNLREVEIDMSKLKEEKKEEEKKLEELPPPPPPKKVEQEEVATIKFLPPEPKKDEEVIIETPPPAQSEIDNKKVSNVTKEGVEDVGGIDIADDQQEVVEIVKVEKPVEEEIFTAVEQQPDFPGGQSAMYKFLGENIKYPAAAQRANVSGRVFVKFVVEKDGSIGAVEVLKGIGFGCDEEAIRVIKSMPKWNPGRQNGKNVRVFYNMPVVYKLD
ncbi:MAG: TonB family protein [Cytophagaceae bacterium]|nr:TonB family protein [Cytophagaceae bacterium]MBK9510615.1 TonB family protein [Cytophagaceae bacterium]MBK9934378.1 TonB family protein [Cytophagaceae bacterium]MBL0300827.1 TonB family protein [Cytophagaceae bacterium]MBL0327770.1 TonB family protein [Cytophagaceae bacterium]